MNCGIPPMCPTRGQGYEKPESYLIDWSQRYAGKTESEWRKPIMMQDWLDPKVIANYEELRRLLNAEALKG